MLCSFSALFKSSNSKNLEVHPQLLAIYDFFLWGRMFLTNFGLRFLLLLRRRTQYRGNALNRLQIEIGVDLTHFQLISISNDYTAKFYKQKWSDLLILVECSPLYYRSVDSYTRCHDFWNLKKFENEAYFLERKFFFCRMRVPNSILLWSQG